MNIPDEIAYPLVGVVGAVLTWAGKWIKSRVVSRQWANGHGSPKERRTGRDRFDAQMLDCLKDIRDLAAQHYRLSYEVARDKGTPVGAFPSPDAMDARRRGERS